ncbi:MAG: hypothetical protein Tsb0010_08350 [Parvularculaceae bacterium]
MRLAYLDNLRIGATGVIIVYHAARLFDYPPFYVKSETVFGAFEAATRLMDIWMMPLFFFIAGASATFALKSRSNGAFLAERGIRLLLPLAFAFLTYLPVIGYFARRQALGGAPLDFFDFYTNYFRLDMADPAGFDGALTPAHLWFILYLFIFAAVSLPLFRIWSKSGPPKFLARAFRTTPALILLLAAPPVLGRLTGITYPNPVFFIWFFWYGFLFFSSEEMKAALRRGAIWAAPAAAVLTPIIIYGRLLRGPDYAAIGDVFGPGWPVFQSLVAINAWCWVLVLLELGRRFWNGTNGVTAYLSRAAYPAYLLHISVIAAVGYYTLQADLPVWMSFPIIAAAALTGVLAIYEVAIRRLAPMRLLFGVK